METNFENLLSLTTALDDFPLAWRFKEDAVNEFPAELLALLNPLNKEASKFLWQYIDVTGLHNDFPFRNGFFRFVDKIRISEDSQNRNEVKKWLYKRGFAFDKLVFLSWQPDTAMVVPWKIFIKYFDDFYYAIADDLTVIDASLNWALLLFHEHEIFFGTNSKYVINK